MEENKARFVAQFGDLLKQTSEMKNLKALVYQNRSDDEYVYAIYNNGAQRRVNVTGSSCWAMVNDIRQQLPNVDYLVSQEKINPNEILVQELMKYPEVRTFIGTPGLTTETAEKANDIFFKKMSEKYTADNITGHIGAYYGELSDYDNALEYNNCFAGACDFFADVKLLAEDAIDEASNGTFAENIEAERFDEDFYNDLKDKYSIADFIGLIDANYDERAEEFRHGLYDEAAAYLSEAVLEEECL